MDEIKSKVDPVKVYQTLADILTRRGQGKVTVISVTRKSDNVEIYNINNEARKA